MLAPATIVDRCATDFPLLNAQQPVAIADDGSFSTSQAGTLAIVTIEVP